ncbi:MAG TPA: PfkB family carbohydrate kinase [Solirubrobacteraceae bacterium]|nr:PfkB family carbohydrate kinase [Solirubrobacteraceae bacterium]
MNRRIVVAGDVMTDVVAALSGPVAHGSDTPARIALRGGGTGANVAVWLAWAGAQVTLIGRVGDDAAGREAAAALQAEGVDARLAIDRSRPTGTCVVLVAPGGERSMLPDAGANAGLEAVALPPGTAHLHLAGYALLNPGSRAGARALLTAARRRGIGVSIDPSSAEPIRRAGAGAFLGWAGDADLLVPNRDEATALTGIDEPAGAARALLAHAREVVVKLGPEGALWTDGEDEIVAPALPVPVRDTTGAGDAFAAGLLAARLAGAGPADALRAGCALAAEAVAREGGR